MTAGVKRHTHITKRFLSYFEDDRDQSYIYVDACVIDVVIINCRRRRRRIVEKIIIIFSKYTARSILSGREGQKQTTRSTNAVTPVKPKPDIRYLFFFLRGAFAMFRLASRERRVRTSVAYARRLRSADGKSRTLDPPKVRYDSLKVGVPRETWTDEKRWEQRIKFNTHSCAEIFS